MIDIYRGPTQVKESRIEKKEGFAVNKEGGGGDSSPGGPEKCVETAGRESGLGSWTDHCEMVCIIRTIVQSEDWYRLWRRIGNVCVKRAERQQESYLEGTDRPVSCAVSRTIYL